MESEESPVISGGRCWNPSECLEHVFSIDKTTLRMLQMVTAPPDLVLECGQALPLSFGMAIGGPHASQYLQLQAVTSLGMTNASNTRTRQMLICQYQGIVDVEIGLCEIKLPRPAHVPGLLQV